MKYFFLLLFYAKTVLLIPEPITISENWTRFTPHETFSSIASGAEIRARLTADTEQLQILRIHEKESELKGSL